MSSGASYRCSNQWGAAYARLLWIEPSCGVETWRGVLRWDGGGGVGWGGEAWGAGGAGGGGDRGRGGVRHKGGGGLSWVGGGC